jgi:hypothetical protein
VGRNAELKLKKTASSRADVSWELVYVRWVFW